MLTAILICSLIVCDFRSIQICANKEGLLLLLLLLLINIYKDLNVFQLILNKLKSQTENTVIITLYIAPVKNILRYIAYWNTLTSNHL